MHKVHVTYFKDSGNFYTNCVYDSDKESLNQIWDEFRDMAARGEYPGLIGGTPNIWFALLEVPWHPHNHPRLFLPDRMATAHPPEPARAVYRVQLYSGGTLVRDWTTLAVYGHNQKNTAEFIDLLTGKSVFVSGSIVVTKQ